MNITKLFFLIQLVSSVSFTYAQTQQGYVKTLGRPDKPGVALSGVSVRVKGGHNAVLSKSDGTFSMLMAGKRNGDAYSLQQVQKTGYELNEMGIIGRQYAFSDKVPLTIVMVSTSQLQADKQRIENNAYKVAEKNYHAKMVQLEKDREAGTITIETYRQKLQDLQDKFEKYQSLIDDLAKHYAHTDYDGLDEREREINTCIENGDLERADSLIHTVFDPVDVLKRNKEALSHIDQNILQANDIIKQANADMAAVLKQQEKDAEYLYQLYTIALSRYDNEKARQYIETRAALDTTNVEWQNEAGKFIQDYLADYKLAQKYFNNSIVLSISQYGEMGFETAKSYNSISDLYYYLGEFDKMEVYSQKVINIYKQDTVLHYENMVYALSNIGVASYCKANYSIAKDYLEKALKLSYELFGKENSETSEILNNLGAVCFDNGQVEEAIKYYKQAIEINEKLYGTKHLSVANNYNGIGGIYHYSGDYLKAIENYKKALEIRELIVGKNHPSTASCYNNIGGVYSTIGDFHNALKWYKNALSIRLHTYGEKHISVADSYGNIGSVYSDLGDYSTALEFQNKALVIRKTILGEEHPDIALSYNSIGEIYQQQGDYSNAIIACEKSLRIRKEVFGSEHPSVAQSYSNLGFLLCLQKEYKSALSLFNEALKIQVKVYGDEHPSIAYSYDNIAMANLGQNIYDKAIEFHTKAFEIRKKIYGILHPEVAMSYNNIGGVYEKSNNFEKAIEYYTIALDICNKTLGNNHPRTKLVQDNIDNIKKKKDNNGITAH